jgi:protein-disulfide isomerase
MQTLMRLTLSAYLGLATSSSGGDPSHPPVRGLDSASITIEVFSDFECIFCKIQADSFRTEILPSNADVRVVYRHLPLPRHKWAQFAAEAAACVNKESPEMFWQVHDVFFEKQDKITKATDPNDLIAELVNEQLTNNRRAAFSACMQNRSGRTVVERDVQMARELSIASTPTIVIRHVIHEGVVTETELGYLIRQAKETLGVYKP